MLDNRHFGYTFAFASRNIGIIGCLCIVLFVLCSSLSSCNYRKSTTPLNPLGLTDTEGIANYDLPAIQQAGVLIVGTLSGPDTYYDYRGTQMGLQYQLAEHFALDQGVSLRVELSHDTLSLIQQLLAKQIDLIALQLPKKLLQKYHLRACGAQDSTAQNEWAVHPSSKLLISALDAWYSDSIRQLVSQATFGITHHSRYTHRRHHKPFLSRSKGIISSYDALFIEAARKTGWDWRLIAALCYQESAFNPYAESWAGALGLMQLMPSTAADLGVHHSDLHIPSINIEAGTRYLQQLYKRFADVRNPLERTKYAIAAYNGGYYHIRDAMALAHKYQYNTQYWDEVSPFVLALSDPMYYRDPVVKYGYMIGSETHQYVYSILSRWQSYGGPMHTPRTSINDKQAPHPSYRKNRFTQSHKILSPQELLPN